MENWNNAKEFLPLPRIGDTTTSSVVEVMYIDGNDGKEKTDTDRYDFNEHIWQKYDVVIAWRNISYDY